MSTSTSTIPKSYQACHLVNFVLVRDKCKVLTVVNYLNYAMACQYQYFLDSRDMFET